MPWLDNTVGKNGYTYLAHESMITLFNGSEIWIGGLGDREQADKILGHEYNTIYFNEISQLSYAAVTTAYSRLAMRIQGCRNLFYYDCNPGSPLHWAYKVFVLKRTFLTGEPIEKPELYQSMLLNPEDNRDNLPEDYIADILDVCEEWIVDLGNMTCRNINTKMVVEFQKSGKGYKGKIKDMPIELMAQWAKLKDGERLMQKTVMDAEEVFYGPQLLFSVVSFSCSDVSALILWISAAQVLISIFSSILSMPKYSLATVDASSIKGSKNKCDKINPKIPRKILAFLLFSFPIIFERFEFSVGKVSNSLAISDTSSVDNISSSIRTVFSSGNFKSYSSGSIKGVIVFNLQTADSADIFLLRAEIALKTPELVKALKILLSFAIAEKKALDGSRIFCISESWFFNTG
jgi:hypothetical protein